MGGPIKRNKAPTQFSLSAIGTSQYSFIKILRTQGISPPSLFSSIGGNSAAPAPYSRPFRRSPSPASPELSPSSPKTFFFFFHLLTPNQIPKSISKSLNQIQRRRLSSPAKPRPASTEFRSSVGAYSFLHRVLPLRCPFCRALPSPLRASGGSAAAEHVSGSP